VHGIAGSLTSSAHTLWCYVEPLPVVSNMYPRHCSTCQHISELDIEIPTNQNSPVICTQDEHVSITRNTVDCDRGIGSASLHPYSWRRQAKQTRSWPPFCSPGVPFTSHRNIFLRVWPYPASMFRNGESIECIRMQGLHRTTLIVWHPAVACHWKLCAEAFDRGCGSRPGVF
jgi:hypothetical protein